MNKKIKGKNKKHKSNIVSEMNFSYARYSFYTSESSKIARQVAFVEGAIFWTVYWLIECRPKFLLITFFSILIIFFIIDLVQYLYGAFLSNSDAQTIKKIHQQNPGKDINYNLGDETGKKIEKFFILKMIFLGISVVPLFVMFKLYATS
ncbi:hypothetical protein ELY21_10285 [Legionella sp. km535]|uniref:hypothetical protein n=1 Tax=Legionella sp. km535 TaxID=2498107 RepID=UPI000F8C4B94|nr:hypothetical protein [Legionella sp. km535]RUR17878.1 hypothetical protein ELY21_10285 [Legionella sp. km535]